MKHCPMCDSDKEESEFYKASSRKDGLMGICKKCQYTFARKGKENTDYFRNYYRKHPDRKRKTQLRQNYGLSLEQYQQMLDSQNGKCAICKSPETKSKRTKNMCVDHDHNTGKIRGLLCSSCNRAIGLLNDEVEVLKSAISYLESNK